MTAPTDARATAEDDDRYGTIETGDGETIIYDRQSPDAWVQSDLLVSCDD